MALGGRMFIIVMGTARKWHLRKEGEDDMKNARKDKEWQGMVMIKG